jgi:cellulose synthase/poly-beta-1,6-N-acetylglucosamine synthase-like glycosyltransferase
MLIFSISQAYLIYFYWQFRNKIQPNKIIFEELPNVTVQLPLFNELYVVERLINAVCNLDYPIEKLEIQVLDDSDDESLEITKELVEHKAKQGYQIVQITRKKNIGNKAGALQFGLQSAKGEFIAIFDADFIPEKEFIKQLLPYFKNNVGMVQSRWAHINRKYSLLTRVQAFALDAHFTIEQGGRNNAGLFINFNGTAGIWRKSCIEDAGGWQYDTLTEDLDLSYRAQLKGWKFEYVDTVSTPAELPAELNAFRSQQHRWTKGSVETSKKILSTIWKADTSFKKKIFASLHLCNSYIFILVFLSGVLSVPVIYIKNSNLISVHYFQFISFYLIGFLIVCIFYLVSYFTKKRSIGSFLLLFPMFISVSMAMSFHNSIAVLEGIFGFKSEFIRTPKFNINHLNKGFKNNIYVNMALPLSFYAEIMLSAYFFSALCLSVYYHDYGLFPFHLMLFIGFFTLIFYGIKQRLAFK